MHCKNCQYPLWRLRARQCPECGTAFNPGDFDFVPYSVRFMCPHCDQEYYGDGPRGHLVPAEFACVNCGQPVQMSDMIVEPAAGVEEARTQTRKVPWLERKSRGFFRAWFQTIGMSLIAPGELMNALPREARTRTAVWFMIFTQAIIWIVAAVPLWVLVGAQMFTTATGRGGTMVGPLVGGFLIILAIGFLFSLLTWLVFGLAGHLILLITGRRDAGPRRTLQAFAFASGANVLTAIPCLGAYIGWIWWVVSATIMLKEGQRVSAWRAVLAVVGPVAVAIALFVGGYAYFVYWAMSTASTAMATATAISATPGFGTMSSQVQTVRTGLSGWVNANGTWPAHAALLCVAGHAEADDFVGGYSGWSDTYPEDVDLGPVTLAMFDEQTHEERGDTADMAAAAMTERDVAHRLGDMVICVSPRDPVVLPPGVWVVIAWPDPSVNAGMPPPTLISVGLGDGTTTPILFTDFDAELAKQNALRAEHGLPALPHPSTVGVGPEK